MGNTLTKFIEHNSFDNDQWILKLVDFTQKLLNHNRVRIVGVCFGHQILGRAAGSKVGRSDDGWEIAVCDVELTKKGKEIFGQDKLVGCPTYGSLKFLLTVLGYSPNAQGHSFHLPIRFRTSRRIPTLSCAGHVQEGEGYFCARPPGVSRGDCSVFGEDEE